MTFADLELTPEILLAVERMGFTVPTPIQEKSIPPMLEGRDVIAKAPTGTGKTCAFGIPLLEALREDTNDVQAVIVCPTRELCIQITDELRELAHFIPEVRILALYGGQPIVKQLNSLKRQPQIVVATPGRLLDHMGRGTVWLGNVYTVVLDEADEMFKMGFLPDVRRILGATPGDAQMVLYSATMPREVFHIAWEYQHDPVEISVEAEGENRPQITQYSLDIPPEQRLPVLCRLLDALELHRVMVFCNRKTTVQRVSDRLKRQGRSVDCLHGDIPQGQRNQVMSGFRQGKFEILVATDVAARGIDVDDVEAVFNYDIPEENEYYLHRIGRTGRAKHCGAAFTFVSLTDGYRLRDIKKYTRSDITPVTLSEDGRLLDEAGNEITELNALK